MKWNTLVSAAVLSLLAGLGAGNASAGPVELATTPLVSGLTKLVPPNIYFILDDSTSMNWEFMPDESYGNATSNCFKNHGVNTLYYNPDVTYVPPKKADGTSYPNATFTSAWTNGFNTAQGTVNLSTSFRAYVTGDNRQLAETKGKSPPGQADNAQAAYYYRFNASPTNPPSTCAFNSSYTKVTMTSLGVSAEQRQNFANWYSYYRTRLLTMKSSAGRAFDTIGDKFRVGFSVISDYDPGLGSSKFLNIKSFEGVHRTNWYSKLYGAGCPTGSGCGTPLRGALSQAGQLYAGKVVTGNDDPVQYSCQQNFTILTTDGYWNTGSERTSPRYGPYRENNSTLVGDQDGVAGTPRPFFEAGKYQNTLADIAMYYYKNDLRPLPGLGGLLDDLVTRTDVSTNNVPTAGQDIATWQHMTTFTLGMGVSGTLVYAENYLSGGSPDYNAILQGTKNWPDPQTGSSSSQVPARIDDLWHAAVNGRGQYLSASNPDSLVTALSKTLAAISVINASAAAAATSSLEPVAGDNYAYVAQYTTAFWYGDLQARDIDLVTGAVSTNAYWSARDLLGLKVQANADTRNIKTFSGVGATKLKDFISANLAAEKTANYFKSDPTNPNGKLTQYDTWTTAEEKAAATDDAMIGFLRGQFGFEDQAGNPKRLFRDRTFQLGDIVNASPVFVKKPPFSYGDAGYAAFAAAQANRKAIVYAGANDGMLHAFNAETGVEEWAYIPSAVIPRLYKLADAGYAQNHEYYVDGPITVGDAYDGANWKTILVGGLGRGGRAMYALDVTDPDNPKALWEFGTAQDSDMGYSYGNAVLTKRSSDGKWVVIFASGYNNTLGDSRGRLYVVDAFTGALLQEILTTSPADPELSGIAKINNYVYNTLVDNSTQYVYGGDLGGSLWRFDLTAGSAQRLGRTSASAGSQPITVRPEVGRVKDGTGNYHRVVYFGTGRYLGLIDLTPSSPSSTVEQGIYAVKDTGTDIGVFTDPAANLVAQTLNAGVTPRTIPNPQPVDWTVKNGWYLLTPVGERINVDPRLQLGTLVVLANEPREDYCEVGGRSWLYSLDFQTGGAVVSQNDRAVGQPAGGSIGTGLTLIRLPTNKLIAIVTLADTTVRAMSVPVAPGAASPTRRVGWREIF